MALPAAAQRAAGPGAGAGDRPKSQAQLVKEAVEAFRTRFQEVLAYEAEVQDYERNSLGREPPGRLKGARLERRRRISRDLNGFQTRLDALPERALMAPRAGQAKRELSVREQALVRRVGQAYDLSRDTAVLNSLQQRNEIFIQTENWVERDKAVQQRDALIDREQAYAVLIDQAREILASGLSDQDMTIMERQLDKLSPETAPEEDSPIQKLLSDPERQKKVQAELLVLLNSPYDNGVPDADEAELFASLDGLQTDLIKASGLVEAVVELGAKNQELEVVEAAMADQGVAALDADKRRAAVAYRSELLTAINELNFAIAHAEPSQDEALALLTTQDALVRLRMFDIGPRAALFATRADALDPREYAALPHPDQWAFLEAQRELITELDEARPAPSPLDGVVWHPPPLGKVLPPKPAGKPKPKPKPDGR